MLLYNKKHLSYNLYKRRFMPRFHSHFLLLKKSLPDALSPILHRLGLQPMTQALCGFRQDTLSDQRDMKFFIFYHRKRPFVKHTDGIRLSSAFWSIMQISILIIMHLFHNIRK